MRVEDAQGWRLALEPARHPFVVLVGGADWATELRAAEALALLEGIAALTRQHGELVEQLMAEEAITLEWERGPLWVSLEGDRDGWDLRFVLTPADGQRGLEGAWPAAPPRPWRRPWCRWRSRCARSSPPDPGRFPQWIRSSDRFCPPPGFRNPVPPFHGFPQGGRFVPPGGPGPGEKHALPVLPLTERQVGRGARGRWSCLPVNPCSGLVLAVRVAALALGGAI